MERIRSPICAVLGHVDHGKTKLLDQIRGSAVVAGEAGGITQAIGASIIPLDTIKKICGPLLEKLNIKFTIPGLLFIDTPGHEAFTSLRKRGGNLADIAILVVDMNEGFMPQTIESVEILKTYKTPFIIAANKIDLIKGWRSSGNPVLQSIQGQTESVITEVETKLYKIVEKLAELGLNSERFDRVDDYTKTIAIVPTSAKIGEGVPELLMVITGLAQKYLGERLKCKSETAKGTILEVKEEKGLGKTMDTIIYDGCLKVNDQIVVGGLQEPIVTKVRALFEPMPLAEMREKKTRFESVREVTAATGVKISAPNIEGVVAGMPLISVGKQNLEKIKEEVQKEVSEVLVEVEQDGIVIKADTLGSLEALSNLLKAKNIPVKRAMIGNISKKDVSEAEANHEKNPLDAVVLGFNVEIEAEQSPKVMILTNKIIYRLIEEFEKWQLDERKRIEAGTVELLTRPCKIQVLSGYVFRQSNPAIVGCEILEGTATTGMQLMKNGEKISSIKEIQVEKENVSSAAKGQRIALAMPGVTIGRQVKEGDILYSMIPEEHFRKLKDLREYLSEDEVRAIKEIAEIMRKKNPVWGI